MKKIALSTLSLALLGTASIAHAQSSVTLYGLIDESIQYVNNYGTANGNKNQVGLYAGNIAGDRWGLKGSEDLGGGLKAIFQLENGFNLNNGSSSRMFGRQAYVGLTSDQFGTLTLGRQYDPVVDLVQGLTGDNFGGSAFTTPGDVDNNDNSSRTNSSVKYALPSDLVKGLSAEAMYGFGGVPGSIGSAQTWAGAAAYAFNTSIGAFSVAAGYFHANNSGLPGTDWSSTSDGTFDGQINSPFSTARSIGIASVAAQWANGPFTVNARYSNAQYKPSSLLTASFNGNQTYNVAGLFAGYQITPALQLGAGYIYTHGRGSDAAQSYHQFSLGGDYTVSKRTDFYLLGTYQHAKGHYGDGDPNLASVADYGYPSDSNSQTIISLGIKHRF